MNEQKYEPAQLKSLIERFFVYESPNLIRIKQDKVVVRDWLRPSIIVLLFLPLEIAVLLAPPQPYRWPSFIAIVLAEFVFAQELDLTIDLANRVVTRYRRLLGFIPVWVHRIVVEDEDRVGVFVHVPAAEVRGAYVQTVAILRGRIRFKIVQFLGTTSKSEEAETFANLTAQLLAIRYSGYISQKRFYWR